MPTRVTSFRSGESIGCPCSSPMNDFGSNRSCCDGPPAINRKITRFTFGMQLGIRAADGLLAARTMSASASPPNPQAADRSIWRREIGNVSFILRCPLGGMIFVEESLRDSSPVSPPSCGATRPQRELRSNSVTKELRIGASVVNSFA